MTVFKSEQDMRHRWTQLEGKKASLVQRCEQYARWTIPSYFPAEESGQRGEMQLQHDSIGAEAVNNMANWIVSVLYPSKTSFFRLQIDQETKDLMAMAMSAEGVEAEAAKQMLQTMLVEIEVQLADAEKRALEYMDMVDYRPQAVTAAALLTITGNALEFHPKDKPVQVYSLRDYCVVRDMSGEVIEIMTRDSKAMETFHPDVQNLLRRNQKRRDSYGDSNSVVLLTQIKLEDDGRYHVKQTADGIMLDTEGVIYLKKELPWIPLVWKLARGDDYGRGPVEEYSGAFHAVNTLSGSLLNIVAIMGDIKFLVRPGSVVNVKDLNNSPSGTYHLGNKDDISTREMDKLNDAQFIATMIDRYEKQISRAFLLMTNVTRDAERVTAEEIRAQANQLESSNGGIYSSLARQWQVPLANILLDQTDFTEVGDGITPNIVTGMDSLSRVAELDNVRMLFADLQMLQTVPDDIRAAISADRLMKFLAVRRQVEYQQFTKTPEEMQADQERAMAQEQAMMDKQAQGQMQVNAAKEME